MAKDDTSAAAPRPAKIAAAAFGGLFFAIIFAVMILGLTG